MTAEFAKGDYVMVFQFPFHAIARVDCGAGVLLGPTRPGTHHLDVCLLGQHLPQMYRVDELTPIDDVDVVAHGLCPMCKGWGLVSMFDNSTVDKILSGEHGEKCRRCGGSGRDGITVWVEYTETQTIGHIDQDPTYADRITCPECKAAATPELVDENT